LFASFLLKNIIWTFFFSFFRYTRAFYTSLLFKKCFLFCCFFNLLSWNDFLFLLHWVKYILILGVTAIEPEWLPVYAAPLCNISEPLSDPPPRFDSSTKKLLCHVSATFGRSGWPLPVLEMEFPPGLSRFKWFARFLLDGSILPKLKKFVPSLLSTPVCMIRTWAR